MTQKTILIVDDEIALVEALTLRFRTLGLKVQTAYNAHDALDRVHQFHPDLICLDVHMPSGSGWQLCEMLAADDQWVRVPTIIMTGNADEETVRRCFNLSVFYAEKGTDLWPRMESLVCELLHIDRGAVAIQVNKAPVNQVDAADPLGLPLNGENATRSRKEECQLLDIIFEMLDGDENLLEEGTSTAEINNEPPWVLCIDDDEDYSMALKLRLENYGVAIVRAFDGMDGLRSAYSRTADLILLDYEMPNGRGDYILRRLKDNPVTKDIPVIVITGRYDRHLERQLLAMGAAKFMNKPPDFQELLLELGKHIPILARPAVC